MASIQLDDDPSALVFAAQNDWEHVGRAGHTGVAAATGDGAPLTEPQPALSQSARLQAVHQGLHTVRSIVAAGTSWQPPATEEVQVAASGLPSLLLASATRLIEQANTIRSEYEELTAELSATRGRLARLRAGASGGDATSPVIARARHDDAEVLSAATVAGPDPADTGGNAAGSRAAAVMLPRPFNERHSALMAAHHGTPDRNTRNAQVAPPCSSSSRAPAAAPMAADDTDGLGFGLTHLTALTPGSRTMTPPLPPPFPPRCYSLNQWVDVLLDPAEPRAVGASPAALPHRSLHPWAEGLITKLRGDYVHVTVNPVHGACGDTTALTPAPGVVGVWLHAGSARMAPHHSHTAAYQQGGAAHIDPTAAAAGASLPSLPAPPLSGWTVSPNRFHPHHLGACSDCNDSCSGGCNSSRPGFGVPLVLMPGRSPRWTATFRVQEEEEGGLEAGRPAPRVSGPQGPAASSIPASDAPSRAGSSFAAPVSSPASSFEVDVSLHPTDLRGTLPALVEHVTMVTALLGRLEGLTSEQIRRDARRSALFNGVPAELVYPPGAVGSFTSTPADLATVVLGKRRQHAADSSVLASSASSAGTGTTCGTGVTCSPAHAAETVLLATPRMCEGASRALCSEAPSDGAQAPASAHARVIVTGAESGAEVNRRVVGGDRFGGVGQSHSAGGESLSPPADLSDLDATSIGFSSSSAPPSPPVVCATAAEDRQDRQIGATITAAAAVATAAPQHQTPSDSAASCDAGPSTPSAPETGTPAPDLPPSLAARVRDYERGLSERRELGALARLLAPLMDRVGQVMRDVAPLLSALAEAPELEPRGRRVRPARAGPAAPSSRSSADAAPLGDRCCTRNCCNCCGGTGAGGHRCTSGAQCGLDWDPYTGQRISGPPDWGRLTELLPPQQSHGTPTAGGGDAAARANAVVSCVQRAAAAGYLGLTAAPAPSAVPAAAAVRRASGGAQELRGMQVGDCSAFELARYALQQLQQAYPRPSPAGQAGRTVHSEPCREEDGSDSDDAPDPSGGVGDVA